MTTADPAERDDGRLDPAVVSALYERHAEELRLFLIGVLRDSDLAAEALQNTFTKTVERGRTAREDSLKGWLFQVAFHEAMLLRRKGQLKNRSLAELARQATGPIDSNQSPAASVARAQAIDDVRRALQELPDDQRRVVEMRIYDEKSFAAIAVEVAAPLGTVLTRMRLAMKKLAQRLKESD